MPMHWHIKTTPEDLQTLRKRIDDAYATAGFRTSRAVIPNQDVSSGTLCIEVVEAGIERIEISGAKRINADYLRARIQAGLGAPVHVRSAPVCVTPLASTCAA